MDDQTQRETERRREAYRNAASNLLAFGYERTDPEPPEPQPQPYVGCAAHGPCCGLPEDDPCWDRTDYMRPSEWMKLYAADHGGGGRTGG